MSGKQDGSPERTSWFSRPMRMWRPIRIWLLVPVLLMCSCRWLADHLILFPSHQPIATSSERVLLPVPAGKLAGRQVEVFKATFGATKPEPDVVVLALTGNAGRAEWMPEYVVSTLRPWFGARPELCVQVVAVQFPGYGTDHGRASLAYNGLAGSIALEQVHKDLPDCPVLLYGLSLGSVATLDVARNAPAELRFALLLEKPPNLRGLILKEHGWWNLWILAGVVAAGVPSEASSASVASEVEAPALFILAASDRIVPGRNSQQVIEAYSGPHKVVRLAGTHNDAPAMNSTTELETELTWLLEALFGG